MGKVIRSPRAKIDLWQIADRIATDNLDAALRLLDRIDEVLRKLAEFPRMGPARDDIVPGLRSFPVGDYLLLYRVTPEGIELVRVVHGSRDLDALFEE